MSRAIASARQRRAGLSAPEPPAPPAINQPPPPGGLTLQQVIALIDTRLTKLEKFAKDTQSEEKHVSFSEETSEKEESSGPISQVLDEFNTRFMMLAEEIAQMKDTLMKLQTYTMDVNKMLLEERVNVLSDLGEDTSMFVMGDMTLSGGDIERFDQSSVTDS
jgi:hypothetical protein